MHHDATQRDILDNNTMDTNLTQSPPLEQLFGPDPESRLQKARDNIYSQLWSRNRRDEAKLDWVISQYGINRNVPVGSINGTPFSPTAPDSIHKLPCWLILTDKKISADFTRYIYTVNELEIDVDLKAIHTPLNEEYLQEILTQLQNPNFVRYTRNVRVRIHFPEMYPFQDLPAFNQRALEAISKILDGFQQLEKLEIRVVSMQGPKDYELRAAAFPFYPMNFTNWSIRMLNHTAAQWDIVDGEQIVKLEKAWAIYLATGSLMARVNNGISEHKSTPAANKETFSPLRNHMATQNKNGSQKKKARKMRTSSTPITSYEYACTTSSVDSSSCPNSPGPAFLESRGSSSLSGTRLPEDADSFDYSLSRLKLSGAPSEEFSDSKSSAPSPIGPLQPSSPSFLPVKLLKMDADVHMSTSDTSGDVFMTPAESLVVSPEKYKTAGVAQLNTSAEDTAERNSPTRSKIPQTSHSPFPVPSPSTLGLSQDEAEALSGTEKVLDRAGPPTDKQNSKQPLKKKRRTRKKLKKSKAVNAEVNSVDGTWGRIVEHVPDGYSEVDTDGVSSDENQSPVKEHGSSQGESGFGHDLLGTTMDVPLAELADIRPVSDSLCMGTKADGTRLLLRRSREVDWFLRQKARVTASRQEMEAERMKAREKRQSKKAKEIAIRRRDPSQPLRRQMENSKQQNARKQSGDLSKITEDLDKNDADLIAYCIRAGLSLDMPVTKLSSNSHGGESGNNLNESKSQHAYPSCYDHLSAQEQSEYYQSQPAACNQPPAQPTENARQWARTVSTEGNRFGFFGSDTQAPMGQEMITPGFDYAGMRSSVNIHNSNGAASNASHKRQRVTYEDASPAYTRSDSTPHLARMDDDSYPGRHAGQQHLIEKLENLDGAGISAAASFADVTSLDQVYHADHQVEEQYLGE